MNIIQLSLFAVKNEVKIQHFAQFTSFFSCAFIRIIFGHFLATPYSKIYLYLKFYNITLVYKKLWKKSIINGYIP